MQSNIERFLAKEIEQDLQNYPVVAILGVRQCGKTTLAKELISKTDNSIYLDLERPSDKAKLLNDAEGFLTYNKNRLICIDEIQRAPELFALIRSMVDENDAKNAQFLILGSASRDLIKQSSETLAGRIAYNHLSPFTLLEVGVENLTKLWSRGGMPKSFLSKSDAESYKWRFNYIKTFIERDLPQLGFNTQSMQIENFLSICSHYHGNIINLHELGRALGLSHNTIKSYIYILEQTFVARLLKPFANNIKKRIVKSPKLYLRDSGILHNLLNIEEYNDLFGHIVRGASWEGFVIENIINTHNKWRPYFYRTASGSEIDLVLTRKNKIIAVECKASAAPEISKGFYNAIDDIKAVKSFVIAPVKEAYPIKNNIMVIPLADFLKLDLLA